MSEPREDKYTRLCSKYERLINKADNPLIKAHFKIGGERIRGYLNIETGQCIYERHPKEKLFKDETEG
jgi:hypothetical protein